jgi:UPF0755 protein
MQQSMSQPRTSGWRFARLAVLFSLALVAATAVTAGVAWHWLTGQMAIPSGGVVVRIEPGRSMRDVARRLQQAGVIRHAEVLVLAARWRGVDRTVQAGEHRFEGRLTLWQVLDQLRVPAQAHGLLTIPEGRSAEEVMELLAAAGLGGADVFACAARSVDVLRHLDLPATGVEGYLFPDTYAFSHNLSPADVLRTMVERYREHGARLSAARVRRGMSEHDMVTLASLIEKETGAPDERRLISAVFHNRLRRGMPLQSDPTAVYERDGFRGPITREDLAFPSAYNTYRIPGLPPGPICNPGLAALEAAVEPAPVDYLYFVSRNDGTHEFSTSYAEHERAVARYQRARRGP